jgi:hypothetical protein
MTALQIRRATPMDAAGIVAVLEAVTAERIHSAIDHAWTVEQELRYLESLSHRETLHLAVDTAKASSAFRASTYGRRCFRRWHMSAKSGHFYYRNGGDKA